MKPGVARLFLGVWWPSPKAVLGWKSDNEMVTPVKDTDHEENEAKRQSHDSSKKTRRNNSDIGRSIVRSLS